MSARLIFPGLALLLAVASVRAAPIRVTTWDLQSGSNTSPQSEVRAAAESLKKLHPDVILLQQVAGWESCRQIADALQPETYHALTCSSFHGSDGKLLSGQVAILAKTKAHLAWCEPWQNSAGSSAAPGGFAFAVLRLGDRNVGFFSVLLDDGASSQKYLQLVRQIASLQNWQANRPQAFIVGGDFNATPDDLSCLEQTGFASVFAGLPLAQRVTLPAQARRPAATLDYIFTRDAGAVSSPLITQSPPAEHCAVTCEIDLAAPAPPLLTARSELPPKPAGGAQTVLWLAGLLAACTALFVCARKLARVATPPAGQIIVAPHALIETTRMPDEVRGGVAASLSRWLKQKAVQRLVSDRTQLLATQQAAALKALAVDQRLSKIERQIQQINQEYERRIDDLLKEIMTAKEENHELIHAKIALVKAEMEKARLKASQQSQEHQQF